MNQISWLHFVGMTGQPLVHPKSFKRLQDKPRTVFYRACGGSLFRTIRVLNAILRGWRQYFKLDTRKGGRSARHTHPTPSPKVGVDCMEATEDT